MIPLKLKFFKNLASAGPRSILITLKPSLREWSFVDPDRSHDSIIEEEKSRQTQETEQNITEIAKNDSAQDEMIFNDNTSSTSSNPIVECPDTSLKIDPESLLTFHHDFRILDVDQQVLLKDDEQNLINSQTVITKFIRKGAIEFNVIGESDSIRLCPVYTGKGWGNEIQNIKNLELSTGTGIFPNPFLIKNKKRNLFNIENLNPEFTQKYLKYEDLDNVYYCNNLSDAYISRILNGNFKFLYFKK